MSHNELDSAQQPLTELHAAFSSPDATPTGWAEARRLLQEAEIYWLSTVRADGRPHVTPLVAIWLDGALYFCTGTEERKAKNLAHSAHCIVTTGCNALSEGLDLVLEGDAMLVSDESTLQRIAAGFATKYDPPFSFSLEELREALVYEVRPLTAFGFTRGETFGQTRWRF